MGDLQAVDALADSWATAVSTGDRQALEKVLDPCAVVWHNHDQIEKSAAATVDSVVAAFGKRPFSYQNIRRFVFPTGYVQQHDVTATGEGEAFKMPVCIVVKVNGSKITRIDEYYDNSQRALL
jgi:ketosteroid isomerase-like protein